MPRLWHWLHGVQKARPLLHNYGDIIFAFRLHLCGTVACLEDVVNLLVSDIRLKAECVSQKTWTNNALLLSYMTTLDTSDVGLALCALPG